MIRPDNTQGFSRLEREHKKIQTLYNEGYEKGIAISDTVKNFFQNSQP